MAYPITKFWFYPLCAIALRKIRGIGNIPKTPFIIVSNHEHLADPLYILFPILRKLDKKVHFVATPAWWFLGDRICRGWAGCIPLFDSRQAYHEAKKLVKSGEIVGIFPEGHLELKIRHSKTGAVRLAAETNTPILPIGIKSSYIPFSSTVNIGKLVYIKNCRNPGKQTGELMKSIYRLRDSPC